MRARTLPVLAAVLLLVAGLVAWQGRPRAVPRAVTVAAIAGDAGDGQAVTSYDKAYVRKRAGIAIHPARGASRARIAAELQAAARSVGAGPLEPVTFAVFSEQMLTFLVPEMSFVLPEGVSVEDADEMMRDHQPAGVAFYVVQPVLVHDLTFGVIPDGVSPARASADEDAEGILDDTLNHYETSVQTAGLTVHYFGAILSDASVSAVRSAMARAAHVPASSVDVEAPEPGPGVDLSGGVPDLSEAPHHHH